MALQVICDKTPMCLFCLQRVLNQHGFPLRVVTAFSSCLFREDDLPPKCTPSTKVFHPDASSSEHDTLTSATNTFNGHYWSNSKSNYTTGSYVTYNCNGCRHSTSRSVTGHPRPVYANGGQPSSGPPKTLIVTANTAPSPKTGARSNGTVGRKAKPPQTRSYAVSQATLERIGAVPVMIPAQSRAGSLV